jgi:Na+-transporting NADH:ubiquinone oxidoreductase subunit C
MEEKKEMNVYLYVIIITSITALILSLLYTSLNPIFEDNKREAKKKSILSCIPDPSMDLTTKESVNVSYEKVKMIAITAEGKVYEGDSLGLKAINLMATGGAKKYKELAELELANEEKKDKANRLYPVYEYSGSEGKVYVVAIRGNGLWDKIWAYVALKDDLNTIAGIYFDHRGETPGLGAEIKDSEAFKAQFLGRKIFDESNNVALTVLKRKKEGIHFVTGISGATITSDGVTNMFVSGMAYYEKYFATLK